MLWKNSRLTGKMLHLVQFHSALPSIFGHPAVRSASLDRQHVGCHIFLNSSRPPLAKYRRNPELYFELQWRLFARARLWRLNVPSKVSVIADRLASFSSYYAGNVNSSPCQTAAISREVSGNSRSSQGSTDLRTMPSMDKHRPTLICRFFSAWRSGPHEVAVYFRTFSPPFLSGQREMVCVDESLRIPSDESMERKTSSRRPALPRWAESSVQDECSPIKPSHLDQGSLPAPLDICCCAGSLKHRVVGIASRLHMSLGR